MYGSSLLAGVGGGGRGSGSAVLAVVVSSRAGVMVEKCFALILQRTQRHNDRSRAILGYIEPMEMKQMQEAVDGGEVLALPRGTSCASEISTSLALPHLDYFTIYRHDGR